MLSYFIIISCALGYVHYAWFNGVIFSNVRAQLENGNYTAVLTWLIPNRAIAEKIVYMLQCHRCMPFWSSAIIYTILWLSGELACGLIMLALLVFSTATGVFVIHNHISKEGQVS